MKASSQIKNLIEKLNVKNTFYCYENNANNVANEKHQKNRRISFQIYYNLTEPITKTRS